jgi:hypothetical protein
VSNLGEKRLEAIFLVAGYVASESAIVAVPTPCVEVPKQITLTSADVLMCAQIWKIYFEQDLSNQNLLATLAELGIVVITAAGTAYVVTRGTTAVVKEITEWAGLPAWGVSALIAGSLTGLFGAAWILYCEYLYSHKQLISS